MADLDTAIRAELAFRLADAQPVDAVDMIGVVVRVLDLCNELEAKAPDGFAEFISGATALRFKTEVARELGVKTDA